VKRHLIVAATGASGALYFVRTVRALLTHGHRVDLVVSPLGLLTLRQETSFGAFDGGIEGWIRSELGRSLKGRLEVFSHKDQAARIASGSGTAEGMVIVPCTMKTLAGVAHGLSSNLIERAADVMLKERRRLVLVPREAPYNLIHLENMVAATRAGAVIVPASPAFYQGPASFDDLGDFIAGRILSLFGLDLGLFKPWEGLTAGASPEPETPSRSSGRTPGSSGRKRSAPRGRR
jgi:4-hydroxy-3-polyprenylbenzoate decarboxylase